MVRWLTAGESHGQALTAIVEGIPAHVEVSSSDIEHDLARRRLGAGRGARMKFEVDPVRILGGVRHGQTLGAPVAIDLRGAERQASAGLGGQAALGFKGVERPSALTSPKSPLNAFE